jgi:hypothetical protein
VSRLTRCQADLQKVRAERDALKVELNENDLEWGAQVSQLTAQVEQLEAQLADCQQSHEESTTAPYGPDSPFNTLVDHSRVHPDSQKIVDRLLSFSSKWPTQDIVAGVSGANDWNEAVYHAKPTDPLLTVAPRPAYGGLVLNEQLRVPAGARVPGGGDGSVVVVATDGGEFGFWRCKIDWTARTITGSGGYYAPPNSKGTHLPDACAAQFGLRAGHIEGQELAAGLIPHALIMVVDCTNGLSVEPAGPAKPAGSCSTRHGTSNAYAPALGQRFFLDMTWDQIGSLSVPGWQKVIMQALAQYGAFTRDSGGGTFKSVSHESYASQGLTDPLVEFCKPYGGRLTWAPFPWREKLRVAA